MLKARKDKSGRLVYRIPKGNDKISLLLYEFEVEILEQLFNHRIIRSIELLDMYLELRKLNGLQARDERNAASQRMNRLKQSGVISHHMDDSLEGYTYLYKTYFYSISQKGIEILLTLGKITSDQAKSVSREIKKYTFSMPSTHALATTAIATRLYIHLRKLDLNYSFKVQKGVHHEMFFSRNAPNKNNDIVIPDLVVTLGASRVIAIEVDGGKQLKDVIADKQRRYNLLMRSDKGNNKSLYVAFVPIDDDLLPKENKGERIQRIKYLKNSLNEFTTYPKNTHYYVLKTREIFSFVERITQHEETLSNRQLRLMLNEWLLHAELNLGKLEYTVQSFEESVVSKNPASNEYTPHMNLVFKKGDRRPKYYFVYIVQNGSVQSHQLYRAALSRIEAINDNEYSPHEVKLFLLYPNKRAMENDIMEHFKTFEVDIIGSNIEEWIERTNHPEEFSEFEIPLYELSTRNLNFNIRKENYRL
ncbi:replication-relaxation family protein [Lysinibacillus xylanilyticus]|uniref:replication-relaxation family protein n=1 Tax=Lysinibacillus xylanilyticus TaxID=582475 RepID=UPI00382BEE23